MCLCSSAALEVDASESSSGSGIGGSGRQRRLPLHDGVCEMLAWPVASSAAHRWRRAASVSLFVGGVASGCIMHSCLYLSAVLKVDASESSDGSSNGGSDGCFSAAGCICLCLSAAVDVDASESSGGGGDVLCVCVRVRCWRGCSISLLPGDSGGQHLCLCLSAVLPVDAS